MSDPEPAEPLRGSGVELVSPSLLVLPLGGCGEIGLNATLLVDGDDALLIDCGVLLGVQNAPGVDRAVPGFEPLFRFGRKLAGVVLTHGHEDHIGALPALLAELDVPVFGTPLTMTLARSRLEGKSRPVAEEARRQSSGRLVPVPLGGRVQVGPFAVEMIRVTHSLPDSAALFVETRAGRVLHSGDFKLDASPHDGRTTDTTRLAELGQGGIDLLLADSTNAEVPGRNRAETEVGLEVDRAIGEATGRVIVACLASHLHRVDAVLRAARRHGRRVALVGRALHEMFKVGLELGHLDADATTLISEDRLDQLPARELLVITTGTQGEPNAGLARLAGGRDHGLRIVPGDRVILSARTIPGNERAVRKVVNQLVREGAEVITDHMRPVHCSGHACQAEQADLLRLVRPRHFVPIHGERSMLEAHARTAAAEGVARDRVLVIEDGQSVVLSSGSLSRGPEEEVSQRAVDSAGRVLDWGDVRERAKIGRAGLVVCSLALDARSGRLLDRPVVTARGLTLAAGATERVRSAVQSALDASPPIGAADAEASARGAIRAVLRSDRQVAPEIHVHALVIDGSASEPPPGGAA